MAPDSPSQSATEKDEILSFSQQHDSSNVDDTNVAYSVFSKSTKRWAVFLIALAGFFSPLSANIYFPSLNYLAGDLGVSIELINLTITAYLICQGIVPSIVGDAADTMGRRPQWKLRWARTGRDQAISTQTDGEIGTIALAISVVSDLAPPHERGKYMGAALCGPNTAPSLGPVLGGVLAEKASWRWIFWFLSILSGLCLVLIIIALPETARKLVGNGSIAPTGVNRSVILAMLRPEANNVPPRPVKPRFHAPNPISCLRIVFHKDTALVLVTNAIFYINYSCVQASLATLLMRIYGLDALQVGLTYLPYGIACGIASFLVGKIMDYDYRKTAARAGFTIDKRKGDELAKFPIERARLRSIWYYVIISTMCTIGYGWTLEAKTVFNTLIVDLHPDCPATASAAVSITRCSAAAIAVSILQFLLDALGPGWTFTIFGGLCVSTGPMLWAEYQWGMQWRTERTERVPNVAADGKKEDPKAT
ncbi:MAG: hypothetical protein Q9170_004454 [Blastenia crenularia]